MIRAGVIGPTGYAGLHLIRLLLNHPDVEIAALAARREERPPISDIWPQLRGRIDMPCSLIGTDVLPEVDAAFIALPHTVAMDHVPALRAQGVRVIDISADYRLRDAAVYAEWYGVRHADPDNLAKAVYGLCEFNRARIARADLVANPGCYPTAVELALAPLLKHGLEDGNARIIVDAKSGISGAGRKPRPHLHFPEANENVTAYRVGTHQHHGEMLQGLSDLAGRTLDLLFVPHLAPMDRGILATCYVQLAAEAETVALEQLYTDFYAQAPFVRVLVDGAMPNTKHVWDTNFADISVTVSGRTAVVISAIDNLIKGAAGQAVQNMNIMFALDETAGLL
jgi:N-acetyl-gamma-glutamyl-phosphate reductase